MKVRKANNATQLEVLLPLLIILGMVLLPACGSTTAQASYAEVPGGDAGRGEQAIQEYGCGSCHTIPGIPSANATVGPPLNDWADRLYIAGSLTNTPENLLFWIQYPQEVEPGTAMPDMGISDQDARDISAYLYTLRRNESGIWPFGGMR